jgi:flagellin FlaB
MKKVIRNEDAFTGLEAAIVLIAFVVVAAVFSYVVLGAGFFTTQKSQEVVHSGVTQASSNIVVKGEVYGIKNDTGNYVEYIRFNVGLAAGGTPVDMNRTSMTFSTENVAPYTVTYDSANFNGGTEPSAGEWVIYEISEGATSDGTLQTAETFTIYVAPSVGLDPREQFLLEIQPEIGAALGIDRTVPPSITNTTLLY